MNPPRRAFQWDLARQTERLDWLLEQLPRYADWGYQELYLHLEDAVEYPSLPAVARPDAYSRRQMERLVTAAGRAGIGVVPIVNLLGHTQYLIKVPGLRDLNELRAADGSALPRGQICPLHPRTLEVAARLIGDLAPFCTAGKMHVGLDESYALGRHPLSRAEIAEVGLAGHFGRYLQRLHGLVAERGLRMGYWADMLALLPGAIRWLPAGTIAYDWYYYPFRRRPALEPRNFQEYDLTAALRARGVAYWGCPMSGPFRHEPMPTFGDRLANLRSWWERCRKVKAEGFLVTAWETSRTGAELVASVDAAAASLWLDRDQGGGDAEMLSRGLRRVFGPRGLGKHGLAVAGVGDPGYIENVARTLIAADRRAYAGYARWENETGWEAAAGRNAAAVHQREAAFFRAGAQTLEAGPPGLRAAWEFRRYLAERDAWVARAAEGLWTLRRSGGRRALRKLEADAQKFRDTIRQGRNAARSLWRRTRDRRRTGPNEAVIDCDAAQLRAWFRWLRAVRRDPSTARGASPVGGAWQFVCQVHLIEPALQQVVLQRRRPDGTWEDVRARFTIEFTAAGAARRTRIIRPFTAPLPDSTSPLRIAVRGIGRIAISNPHLTNGITLLRPKGLTPIRRLGQRAPKRGFPTFDWIRNAAAQALVF